MIKVTARALTGFFVMSFLGLFILPLATFAQTAPALTIATQTQSATTTTYAINLTNNGDIFNLVEFEFLFASNTSLVIGTIESDLCRPEFTISNTLNTTQGSWYVACGTFKPFSGATTTLATFNVLNSAIKPEFSFGTNTALYRHDGLGTKIVPSTNSRLTAIESSNALEVIKTTAR